MEQLLEPVRPVHPVAPYIGGKRALARTLSDLIAGIPHDRYAEPFIGMGGVFLRRCWRPRTEIINDISADVVTLFRILQRHYQAFLDTIKWQLSSRAEFERLMRVDPVTLTDLERAARFLYLQRAAFGGKVTGRNFGMPSEGGSRFDLTRLVPILEAVHDRLSGVTIERLPFDAFIRQYDGETALFYLDPPYFGCETDYGEGVFARSDFERMAELLAGISGRFLLSINDTAEIRATFAAFPWREVNIDYRVSGAVTPAAELIITNAGPEALISRPGNPHEPTMPGLF
jgi:DNA adenine methylase